MHDCPSPPPQHFHFCFSLAAIIKLPTNPTADIAYKDLVCTEQDKAHIYEILTSVADNSKFSLLLKQNHLKNLGAQINHVHPLKFLATSIGTPQMKSCLMYVFDDYFKRNGYMDGLGPSLTREAEKGKLEMYLAPFAEEVGVKVEEIQPFFMTHDWEGLVRFLIHT